VDTACRAFYAGLADLAVALGAAIDIFALGPRRLGLAALGTLCSRSGGACYHYASPDDAALPQDLCRRLQTPLALGGLLRVRTCPELRVARAYGRLVADPDHDQMYHVVA
jgi:Sec23/Sec24 trunk domain